jgi:hypothetical protein
VTELSEYGTDVDQKIARRSIRAISDIAVSTNFNEPPPQQFHGVPHDAYAAQQAHRPRRRRCR